MSERITVRLAHNRWDWLRFAIIDRPGFTFVGTVQQGYQVGALGLDRSGKYYQVNGDVLQLLNERKVVEALKRANERHRSRVDKPGGNMDLPRPSHPVRHVAQSC